MRDGQFAWPVIACEHRKIIVLFQNAAQHVRCLGGVHVLLEHRIESGEVDEN